MLSVSAALLPSLPVKRTLQGALGHRVHQYCLLGRTALLGCHVIVSCLYLHASFENELQRLHH